MPPPAHVFCPPLGGSLPTSSQNSQLVLSTFAPPIQKGLSILRIQGGLAPGSKSSSCSATSSEAVIPTSSNRTVSSNVLQLPSTSKGNDNNDTEKYKQKIKELEEFVELLKKKLENAGPSHYKKLQKLLELISSPKKKVQLSVLLHCEKVLKKCIPDV